MEDEVRKGVTNARFNDTASNLFFGELLMLSVTLGLIYQSWAVFGTVLLITIVLSYIRKTLIILMAALSITWTILSYWLGLTLGGWMAAVPISIIALIFTVGIHIGAYEWIRDID